MYGARATAPGLRGVHLGDEPNHAAIAMDAEVGPLTPKFVMPLVSASPKARSQPPRASPSASSKVSTSSPTPRIVTASSPTRSRSATTPAMPSKRGSTTCSSMICVPMAVDSKSRASRTLASLIPTSRRVTTDVTSDDEVSPTKLVDESDKYAGATLGRFQAGPSHIAEDAELSLTTWECDFEACGAQHVDVNVGQYVDDSCGDLGGVGCEGALGDQTRCRACYLVKADEMDFAGNLGYPRCPMCLCKEFDLPVEQCILCSGFYKYFKFEVVARARRLPRQSDRLEWWRHAIRRTRLIRQQWKLDSHRRRVIDEPGRVQPVNGYAGQTPYHQGPGAAVDGVMEQKFFSTRGSRETDAVFPHLCRSGRAGDDPRIRILHSGRCSFARSQRVDPLWRRLP